MSDRGDWFSPDSGAIMGSKPGPVSDSATTRLLNQARALVAERRWESAAELYRKVVEIAPSQVEALEGLGFVALQSNQAQDALDWLQRARQSAATNASVLGLLGIALKRSGKPDEAMAAYERALALDPENYAAVVNLARALREAGKLGDAVSQFERATRLAPRSADALSMLSNVRRELGELSGALSAAETALRIDPLFVDAHVNRAAALHLLERFVEAAVSWFCAWTRDPENGYAAKGLKQAFRSASKHSTERDAKVLGWIRTLTSASADAATCVALADWEHTQGRPENALACFEHSLHFAESAAALRAGAQLLWGLGLREKAKARLHRALQFNDANLESHRLLATWATLERDHPAAEVHWRKVVEAAPEEVDAHVNLAAALLRQARPCEATRLLERALELDPTALEVYVNLGLALCDQGRFAQARSVYEKGLSREEHRVLVSNRLFSMHYDPSVSDARLLEEHVVVGRKLEANAEASRAQHASDMNPERTLRVGFVSPDFRNHPVAFLLEPYLREHDSSACQLYGYSDVTTPDATTARLACLFHEFRACADLTDEALAAQVREDQIDILFDLAGHTAHNRLPVFARKPSPIQASWLGYFSTTGLRSVDYRIGDSQSIPEGMERYFVEQVVRLPRTSNCYRSPIEKPVGLSERLESQVSFGCFNNPAKITREVVACFARILHGVPGSKLILKYGAFADPDLRSQYVDWFASESIPETRLELRPHSSLARYFEEFADIDIALDPFPYSGETTALHTLWMGVPLVAMEGSTLVQRLASRVLRIAGFDDWVALTIDEYVTIAVSLAKTRLNLWQRESIRAQLAHSPLMDYPGFAREFESALRRLWRNHCAHE